MRSNHAFVVPALLLALLGAACGGGKTKATAPVPIYTIGVTEAGAKFSFTIPADMKGGIVTLRMNNTGKEAHDFQLVKQSSGHTLDELVSVFADEDAPLPDWLSTAGGVGTTSPGTTNEATLSVAAGSYWYICTESSEDGETHAAKGMAGAVTFTGDSGAALPKTAASIAASEYTFATSGFVAGNNKVTFKNAGRQLHHVIMMPISAGKTLDDVKKALSEEGDPTGPPPVDFSKAVVGAVLDPGVQEFFTADLQAGTTYALICFIPDKGTAGPSHAAKGMLVELKVS
jgi:uncharacterized cupredoxin-like copper-binding protein